MTFGYGDTGLTYRDAVPYTTVLADPQLSTLVKLVKALKVTVAELLK